MKSSHPAPPDVIPLLTVVLAVLSRIQDELVRYLVAKRLLSELAVLVRQLHPYCDSIIDPSLKVSAATGRSSKKRCRTPGPPILRLKMHGEPDVWSLSSGQALPLVRLLAPIAELVDVFLSTPLRGMVIIRPTPLQATKTSTLGCNAHPGGNIESSPDGVNASMTVLSGGERRDDSRAVICKSMEDLREGRATGRPEVCGVLRGAPGAMRVVVELVSLLAAMVGTGRST